MLTKVSNAAVVVAGIKHDKVKQVAHLEVTPDTEAVVHVDLTVWVLDCVLVMRRLHLPKRHPLEVCSNSVHLTLLGADLGAVIEEGFLGVVQTAEAVAVGVVGNFYIVSIVSRLFAGWRTVVIPHRNPGEVLVRGTDIMSLLRLSHMN